jgi:Predicted nucleotide-binding protein containing TIR-like domain
MASRTRNKLPPPPKEPAALTAPRKEAEEKIQRQIDAGEELLRAEPRSHKDIDELIGRKRIWSDYNKQLLRNLFTTSEIAEEYSAFVGGVIAMEATFGERLEDFREDVGKYLTRLRSIFRRLELFPEPAGTSSPVRPDVQAARGNIIFIVHGHNNEAKETVARFLEKVGMDVVILHEQPDRGRTIIEKIEAHTEVGFAVVLLTADDIGTQRSMPDKLKPRARQNVIFELGYFVGTLGRAHVCTLIEDGVELPSDFSGVLYVPLDDSGNWKFRLASEIKAAGIHIDLNRIMTS